MLFFRSFPSSRLGTHVLEAPLLESPQRRSGYQINGSVALLFEDDSMWDLTAVMVIGVD